MRKFPVRENTRHIRRQQDNYEPIVVPAKGRKIAFSKENIAIYKRVIEVYEGNQIEVDNDSVFINQKIRIYQLLREL